jgi:hypothetical protein
MLNPNHPAVLKAAAVSGLSGDALLEKALLIGLKQIAAPKTKVLRVKANPDAPIHVRPRLTGAEIMAFARSCTLSQEQRIANLKKSAAALKKSARTANISRMTDAEVEAEIKAAKRDLYERRASQ